MSKRDKGMCSSGIAWVRAGSILFGRDIECVWERGARASERERASDGEREREREREEERGIYTYQDLERICKGVCLKRRIQIDGCLCMSVCVCAHICV